MKWSELVSKWNNYFFKDAPVDGICIFRILFGTIILSTFFQDALFYRDLWGPEAIVGLESSMKSYPFAVLNIFQYLPQTEIMYLAMILIQIISLCFFIFGYKTRTMAILSFVLLVSFHQRNINLLSSADLLIRIIFMYLIMAPCGNKYSLDAIFARKKGNPLAQNHAPWIHRIIQIQIAVVYVSTVIAKSKGHTWVDGSAVYYATRLVDFERFPVPFVLDNMFLLKMMTWSTLVLELALGTLIFIKEFRMPLIILGIGFHLGIEYMMAIPTFEWLMIICLIGMIQVEEYPKYIEYTRALFISLKQSFEKSKLNN